MVKCKICGKTFKRMTASHIKTHGLTYNEYLIKYEYEEYYNKKGAELLEGLYVNVRSKWLVQIKGRYIECKRGKSRKWGLNIADLKNHLQGKQTFGIFFPKGRSRVIGLDIDISDIEALERVYKAVNAFIPEQAILTSYSGNKGYHVDILLDDLLDISMIKGFYNLILSETELSNTELELRGAGKLGYKLPLGINRKTGEWCYLCTYLGAKISDNKRILDKLKEIEPVNTEKVIDAVEMNDIFVLNEQEEKEIEKITDSIKPLEIYDTSLDELINGIERDGIKRLHTRHNKAFVLAIAYRDKGLCQKDIEDKLLSWHKRLDKSLYKSSWQEIERDCKEIAKDVFKEDEGKYKYHSKRFTKEAIITEEDMKMILSVKAKGKTQRALRKVLYALMIHAKMFADNEGDFYMTYQQMEEVGLIKKDRGRIKKWLEMLEERGHIQIVSSNVRQEGSYKNKPNYYKVIGLKTGIEALGKEKEAAFMICNRKDRCRNCIDKAICYYFSEDKIKELFSYRKARRILKAKPCPANKRVA